MSKEEEKQDSAEETRLSAPASRKRPRTEQNGTPGASVVGSSSVSIGSDSNRKEVQDKIKSCMQLCMNKEEAVKKLFERDGIDPGVTRLEWNGLEQENAEFFEAYYKNLIMKKHHNLLNYSTTPLALLAPMQEGIQRIAVNVPSCQVEGCHVALLNAKDYNRRHKVCEMHSKAPKVIVLGLEQRFCYQCTRFHVVSEFDDAKRSCRRSLARYNERKRKSYQDSVSRNSSQGSSISLDPPKPNFNPGSSISLDPPEPNFNPGSTILPDPPEPNSNPDFGTLLDPPQPKIDVDENLNLPSSDARSEEES